MFGTASQIKITNEPKFDALDIDVICNTSLLSYIYIPDVVPGMTITQKEVNCSKK